MSCHSRDGFKSSVRLVSRLTGADRPTVERTLHALRAEATGADLPGPTQQDMDDWAADALIALDSADLPMHTKDSIARGLMAARGEATDGRDFYVQSQLLARTRQQVLVEQTPGLVDMAAPGAHAASYERDADGRPAKVWYASYGSNLYTDRFNVYIEGGSPNGGRTTYLGARDKTPVAATIPVALPGNVHYAGDSHVWTGGVAFLDTEAGGKSLGRAHLITAAQFDDVVFQESNAGDAPDGSKVDLNATVANGRQVGAGLYGTLVHVGDYQGAPVVTFTSPFATRDALRGDMVITDSGHLAPSSTRGAAQAAQAQTQAVEDAKAAAEGRAPTRVPSDWPVYSNAPSAAYQSMIGGGLAETFGLTSQQTRTYFAGATGYGRRADTSKPATAA